MILLLIACTSQPAPAASSAAGRAAATVSVDEDAVRSLAVGVCASGVYFLPERCERLKPETR